MAALFQDRKIQGSGDWDTNAELQELLALRGTKLGDWQTEEFGGQFQQAQGMDRGEGQTTSAYTRRYIDTAQWGRIYDQGHDQREQLRISGNQEGQVAGGAGNGSASFTGALRRPTAQRRPEPRRTPPLLRNHHGRHL